MSILNIYIQKRKKLLYKRKNLLSFDQNHDEFLLWSDIN